MQTKIIYLILSIILIVILFSIFFYLRFEEEKERKQILIVKKFQPRLLRQSPLLLKKEDFEHLSPWQKYVTPFDSEVQKIANEIKNEREAYKTAVRWIWVSDATLNGVDEKWLMPHEFLLNTPNYPTNPVQGRPASDCEEQAYTLVSLLRAIGIGAENVRVVVGRSTSADREEDMHGWKFMKMENGLVWKLLLAPTGMMRKENFRIEEDIHIPISKTMNIHQLRYGDISMIYIITILQLEREMHHFTGKA